MQDHAQEAVTTTLDVTTTAVREEGINVIVLRHRHRLHLHHRRHRRPKRTTIVMMVTVKAKMIPLHHHHHHHHRRLHHQKKMKTIVRMKLTAITVITKKANTSKASVVTEISDWKSSVENSTENPILSDQNVCVCIRRK